eukprot:scaffold15277_cov59-Phaeocystis_antarctica.AAC.2
MQLGQHSHLELQPTCFACIASSNLQSDPKPGKQPGGSRDARRNRKPQLHTKTNTPLGGPDASRNRKL